MKILFQELCGALGHFQYKIGFMFILCLTIASGCSEEEGFFGGRNSVNGFELSTFSRVDVKEHLDRFDRLGNDQKVEELLKLYRLPPKGGDQSFSEFVRFSAAERLAGMVVNGDAPQAAIVQIVSDIDEKKFSSDVDVLVKVTSVMGILDGRKNFESILSIAKTYAKDEIIFMASVSSLASICSGFSDRDWREFLASLPENKRQKVEAVREDFLSFDRASGWCEIKRGGEWGQSNFTLTPDP